MRVTRIPSPSDGSGHRAARILVVDDEPELRDMLRRRFAYQGCDVDTAMDGEEALLRIEAARPDVVVTDIRMPRMDGVELVKRVRAGYPMVAVIVMTGHVAYSTVVRCMNNGAATCVLKPLHDLAELEDAVDEALNAVVRWWQILGKLQAMKKVG
ncbi:MAG: response regulator [Myxococcales bacterium]|nr:response regulator [Myxococcales bacterium]